MVDDAKKKNIFAPNPLGPGAYFEKRDLYRTGDKARRVVCLERFGSDHVSEARKILKDAGYTFTEEDFLNNFWGTRFVIDRPTGKGVTKKLNFLFGHNF
jgi:hypothetical protein